MENAQVNLARRLRPQTFSQIIGQDIPVRMLQNSLYMNKFFPVYLFSGQRGCGKTSTARVFAAAINCDQLTVFQASPAQTSIPCLKCYSCIAMQRSAHPDFIEIDAASNTGVDNVRQLIETAAYVPLQGRKKVYLIDEAHMLSKAAFNALLKILEEPPVTVLFMLATTELHKIPQTVLSRCFQLSFPALEQQAFSSYLRQVCDQENIEIEDAALATLIDETDGSARDALNLLEQIRFIESPITEASIRKVLGKLSIATLLDLIEAAVDNNPAAVVEIIQAGGLKNANPQATWELLVTAVKFMLWRSYTVIKLSHEFAQYEERFALLAKKCSHNRLLAIMQLLWEQEEIFLQTTKKLAFLEFLFIQLAEQDNIVSIDELLREVTQETPRGGTDFNRQARPAVAKPQQQAPSVQIKATIVPQKELPIVSDEAPQRERPTTQAAGQPESVPQQHNPAWQSFLTLVRAQATDAVMLAILEQAQAELDAATNKATLLLRHNSKFFTDKLEEMKPSWFPLLQEAFGNITSVGYGQQQAVAPLTPRTPTPTPASEQTPLQAATPRPRPAQPVTQSEGKFQKPFRSANQNSSTQIIGEFVPPTTPFASLLITYFPGKLKRLKNFN